MTRNNIYKAFANEQRLKLLRCLSKPKNVTELLDHCALTQSALSQHLKVLREAKVVKTEREGKEVVYSVDNKKVTQITNLLLDFK
jgi:DNA-binding transcriptional ArsR family regulator